MEQKNQATIFLVEEDDEAHLYQGKILLPLLSSSTA
jgi:hypothetical protein